MRRCLRKQRKRYSKNTSRRHVSGANVLPQFQGNMEYIVFSFLHSFCKLLTIKLVIVNCAPLSLIHSVTRFAMEATVIIPTNKFECSRGLTDKLETLFLFYRWFTLSTNGWQKNCKPASGRKTNAQTTTRG